MLALLSCSHDSIIDSQDLTNADMTDKGVDIPFLDLVGYGYGWCMEAIARIFVLHANKIQDHTSV